MGAYIGLVIAAILLVLAVLFLRNAAQFSRAMREPAHNPGTFLSVGRRPGTRSLVVCAGDSITHGVVSANYVDLLRQRFAADGDEFVNAGINGNLAYNVLQRLDAIIACQPDVVTLLIGTNDVNATFNQAWEDRYRREQKIPEKPTLAWYRQNVERIIDRLQAETHARIAVLDLPMLGEDLSSDMNRKVLEYNAALREIARARNVPCLPVHEKLSALLSDGHTPPPYEGNLSLALLAGLKRYLLHQQWDAISASHGLQVLTDHIHLNEKAAGIIVELIGGFLSTASDPAS